MTDIAERKRGVAPRFARVTAERLLDFFASVVLIMILAPLQLLLWYLVRSTSAGPLLFRQERLGRTLRPFARLRLPTEYVNKIYEDTAQAHGAAWQGQTGTFGVFNLFSLYPSKYMTSSEGGIVSCANARLAPSFRLLRNQGMERRYENELVGFNARITNVYAPIGRMQLAKQPGWTGQRRRNARFLDTNLRGVIPPRVPDGFVQVYHQYAIRIPDDRDGFVKALTEEHGC